MKLFSRYSRINVGTTVCIFLLTMMVLYFFLKQLLVRQVDEDLKIEQTEIITYANRYYQLPEVIQQADQQIFYSPATTPIPGSNFTTIFEKQGHENLRQLQFSLQVPDGWYIITINKSLKGTDHLTRSVANIVLSTILLMLTATFVVNRIVLKRLWQPFYKTLATIQQFRLGEGKPLQLTESNVDEFNFMNSTLRQAMQKADQDYILLKEFTENASHELQTPLAVIQNKLEIIMQDSLSETQSHAIESASDAIKLLSRFNRSLLLLTKIQNNQFAYKIKLNLKTIIEKKLESFKELIIAKDITLDINLDHADCLLNSDLTNMLVSNLLSNAVKHNFQGGIVAILLTQHTLEISNSSLSAAIDPERLFTRFYNPAKAINSTGLGLSIIKQICNVSGIQIQYQYVNEQHRFLLFL